MKRYELAYVSRGYYGDSEMLEDGYGDWVRFEDVEQALAARDATITKLREMVREAYGEGYMTGWADGDAVAPGIDAAWAEYAARRRLEEL